MLKFRPYLFPKRRYKGTLMAQTRRHSQGRVYTAEYSTEQHQFPDPHVHGQGRQMFAESGEGVPLVQCAHVLQAGEGSVDVGF